MLRKCKRCHKRVVLLDVLYEKKIYCKTCWTKVRREKVDQLLAYNPKLRQYKFLIRQLPLRIILFDIIKFGTALTISTILYLFNAGEFQITGVFISSLIMQSQAYKLYYSEKYNLKIISMSNYTRIILDYATRIRYALGSDKDFARNQFLMYFVIFLAMLSWAVGTI